MKKRPMQKILTTLLVMAIVIANLGLGGMTVQATTISSDATLKSLSLDQGTMTPEFSANVTDYVVTVDESVEKVGVTCSTTDTGASVVQAGGFKDLQMGSNQATITVQAADGTKLTYNITIQRGESAGASTATAGATSGAMTSVGDTDGLSTVKKYTVPVQTPTTQTQPTTPVAESIDANAEETSTEATDADSEVATPATDYVATPSTVTSDEMIAVGEDGGLYFSYYVHTMFDQSLLPQGFVERDIQYKGYTVQSAYFPAGDITLLYLDDGVGNRAGLRCYYEDYQTFLDFYPFYGKNGSFIFPTFYDAKISIPANYTSTFLPTSEDYLVDAYIYTELTGNPLSVPAGMEDETTLQPGESAADAQPVTVDSLYDEPEFYLMYCCNEKGETCFYLYDIVEDTFQRYVERDTSFDLDQSYLKYKEVSHMRFVWMCVMIVIIVLFIFVFINLITRNRELHRELYGDDYDDEDEDDDDDEEDDDENLDEDDIEVEDIEEDEEVDDDEADIQEDEEEAVVEDDGDEVVDEPEVATELEEASFDEEEDVTVNFSDETDTSEAETPVEEVEAGKEAEATEAAEDDDDDFVIGTNTQIGGFDFSNPNSLAEQIAAKLREQGLKPAGMDTAPMAGGVTVIPMAASKATKVTQTPVDETPDEQDAVVQETEPVAKQPATKSKEFRMINLSRTPEPSGIDDDFEFEFINLDN